MEVKFLKTFMDAPGRLYRAGRTEKMDARRAQHLIDKGLARAVQQDEARGQLASSRRMPEKPRPVMQKAPEVPLAEAAAPTGTQTGPMPSRFVLPADQAPLSLASNVFEEPKRRVRRKSSASTEAGS